ncbi:MFS transporter [Kordiimonas aquimaris]|uniref:MFS transporter n=1 Tax=Kordiimonas aquimaris TaxID=707591 RepID=UPI0021CF1DD8|nr:MFS transporter [Kordiimonas aquimaris]
MAAKNKHFLLTKRFFPLFLTQFLGAFNDNLFRQAVIILITFRFAAEIGMSPPMLTNLAVGLFILPFFIFSALAGQMADKLEKSDQIVWIKVWEIGLMILGAVAFHFESLPMMIAVLAGLGLQSTFFGPIKYGILPDLMKEKELLGANALVEAGTFIAILAGTIIGGILVLSENGLAQVSLFMIAIAVIGTFSGRLVPKTGQAAPDLTINLNIFTSTRSLIKSSWSEPTTKRAMLGISWIWLLGTIFIAQIPDIVKNRLNGDEQIVTMFMACFSLGIGVGSLACNRILKGALSARLAAPGLLVLMIASTLLYLILPNGIETTSTPMSITAFMSAPTNWIITTILTIIAMSAGMVIVPLYAVLQHHTQREKRSRIMAATNIVNSAFMAGGSLIAAALIGFGLSSPDILLIVGLANLGFLPGVRSLHKSLT